MSCSMTQDFCKLSVDGWSVLFTACPYDYVLTEAGCHKVVSERSDWDTAARSCSEYGEGGHLVFINDENEQQHINNMIRKYAGYK
jgi:hypothetical protein